MRKLHCEPLFGPLRFNPTERELVEETKRQAADQAAAKRIVPEARWQSLAPGKHARAS
jgi:hypothetical protein